MPNYHVFISHKTEDVAIARTLQRALKVLSESRLKVHISGDMDVSEDWRKWIEDHIILSQALIFLYTATDSDEDWHWCVYEIGIFQGKKATEDRKDVTNNRKSNILCIKHPAVPEPPQVIKHLQVRDADSAGISALFDQLIYQKGTFSPEPVGGLDDRGWFKEEVEKVANAFKLLLKIDHFEKQIIIRLNQIEDKEIKEIELNEAAVSGNAETMSFLGLPIKKETKWHRLYSNFQAMNQSTWLDQIAESIELIKQDLDPIDVMEPVTMPNGETFIPVVSRVETYRVTKDQTTTIKPKQLFVIFTPMPKISEPPYTLRDMRALTSKWINYPPTSVVRVKWKRRRGIKYHEDDILEAVVCAANPKFAQLWDFKYEDFFPTSGDDPNKQLDDPKLFDFVKSYIEPDHLDKFVEDQERLFERIVLKSQDGIAKVPLQFNMQHPIDEYKDQAYLPYLISKHMIGDVSGEHEMYLLVCYIKHFLPLDHTGNPGNQISDKDQ